MRFFTRAASEQLGTEQGRRQWHERINDYLRHLEAIGASLPPGARRLARFGLHDSRVLHATWTSPVELWLRLDARASHAPHEEVVLAFRNVKQSSVPPAVIGDTWLYEEIDRSDVAAFQLSVLLGAHELEIAADDVAFVSCPVTD